MEKKHTKSVLVSLLIFLIIFLLLIGFSNIAFAEDKIFWVAESNLIHGVVPTKVTADYWYWNHLINYCVNCFNYICNQNQSKIVKDIKRFNTLSAFKVIHLLGLLFCSMFTWKRPLNVFSSFHLPWSSCFEIKTFIASCIRSSL